MTRVVALVGDLMDQSHVRGSIDGLEIIRSAADASGADVVIVDLARHAGSIAEIRRAVPGALLVAYGRHDDPAALAAASAAGADRVFARSRFFKDPAAAIAPEAASPDQ
jgi:DNA-binding NarL/FixJ family response regulator